MCQRRAQNGEAVAAATRRARQVDDERRTEDACRASRERPCGVLAIESARSACAIPGASRSNTSRVASGVTSRGASPVPPVVRTNRAEAASSRIAAAIWSRSSGTARRSTS